MSRWFRFYDDAINDPKILKLSDKLHRVWIGILCAASKNSGQLPPIADLALMVRMKPAKLEAAVKSLIIAGLIDDDGVVTKPHNWDARQYKSDVSTDRVKRFRNGKRNVSETPPDTDTETDTEKKKDAAPEARDPEADLFCRGRELFGAKSGGLIAKLIKVNNGSIAKARAAIETASTKAEPREYIGAIVRGRDSPEDLRARGEAW